MHEMSVAMEVCRIAEERLGREALPSLRAVGLEVGDDAGVELSSLSFCLETLLGVPPFARYSRFSTPRPSSSKDAAAAGRASGSRP